jgi:(1->4)-alpha-D-glucan 1-alpha-D-glucosylmutase
MERWPHALNATATHDTKRGEDARARIHVISELPEEWERNLEVPDHNDEYFLYQTLIGAWPGSDAGSVDFLNRLKGYLIKAVREAKVHTEWLKPDLAYEEAYMRFVDAIAAPDGEFLAELKSWSDKLTACAIINSLARTIIKVAAPGVPDFYQGTELWDLSYVDPDNRRPVDFAARRKVLADLKRAESTDRTGLLARLMAAPEDGAIKFYVTYKTLELRRAAPDLFQSGEYLPLVSGGSMAAHVCAFARRQGDAWAIAALPRLLAQYLFGAKLASAGRIWEEGDLLLPAEAGEHWVNVFTGRTLRARHTEGGQALALPELFGEFPVALLRPERSTPTAAPLRNAEDSSVGLFHGG